MKNKIRIKLFGGLKNHFPNEIDFEVDEYATGETLLNHLANQQPAAIELLKICRLAVNETLCSIKTSINPTDEVALLPPFSGG